MKIYQSFSGCRNEDLPILLRMQEFRFTTPSQDAGITVLSMGTWGTHSSALGLQTQQFFQPFFYDISTYLSISEFLSLLTIRR
jgi:hypothetical protein